MDKGKTLRICLISAALVVSGYTGYKVGASHSPEGHNEVISLGPSSNKFTMQMSAPASNFYNLGKSVGAADQNKRDIAFIQELLADDQVSSYGFERRMILLDKWKKRAEEALHQDGFYRKKNEDFAYPVLHKSTGKPLVLKDIHGTSFEASLDSPERDGFALYGDFKENGKNVFRRAKVDEAEIKKIFKHTFAAYNDYTTVRDDLAYACRRAVIWARDDLVERLPKAVNN